MKNFVQIIALLTTLSGFAQGPGETKIENALKFESADKQFKYQIGGRINWDNAFFFQDDTLESLFGHLNNGNEFRRARIFVSGSMYENVAYKFDFDITASTITAKDVYVELQNIPLVKNIRLGHMKEPLRLDWLTSGRFITFNERSFHEGFVKDRATGILLQRQHLEDRLGWQAGLYRNSNTAGNSIDANDGYSITARLTGLPVANEDNSRLLHLGLAYSYRATDSRTASIKGKESHLGHDYAATGTINNIDKTMLLGGELAMVMKSFALQTEYLQATLSSTLDSLPDVNLSTWYGQISYFLTGEKREYESSFSGFGRTSPNKNFGKSGAGAWELGLRYSGTDLNDGYISGGAGENVSAVLNWYLNPNTRFNIEYILAHLDNTGSATIIQSRVGIDF